MKRGGNIPTVYNAANEKAVAMFLDRKIRFLDIWDIIEYCMKEHHFIENPSLEEILATEQEVYDMIESRW
jgi:1-deoxy-D-xylulose-5-phosphate reductoisomerase